MQVAAKTDESAASAGGTDAGASYYTMYEDMQLQRALLEDGASLAAWRDAIQGNAALFKNKTVLHVGCGMGLLSLWVAQVRAGGRGAVGSTLER